jgi:hypothetical protein
MLTDQQSVKGALVLPAGYKFTGERDQLNDLLGGAVVREGSTVQAGDDTYKAVADNTFELVDQKSLTTPVTTDEETDVTTPNGGYLAMDGTLIALLSVVSLALAGGAVAIYHTVKKH